MKLKINLEFPFKFCAVIINVSIFLILLKILWLLIVFFIKLHVLIHLKQNGVAERKNRHLVERTLTILIHGDVPQCFWGDVVPSACYLINRMPS